MNIVLALLAAYLLGSIPSAFVAGKLSRGIDLRRHGSGNLGATNAFRVLGSQLAAVVWIADTVKGTIPVLLLPGLFNLPSGSLWPMILGLMAIVGHTRSLFLGTGGGKGVATAAGVFLALAPVATLLAVAAWCVVLWQTGFVSVASLTAAVTLAVALIAIDGVMTPEFAAAALVTLFVFWSHRENIQRLRDGTESKFRGFGGGQRSAVAASAHHKRSGSEG